MIVYSSDSDLESAFAFFGVQVALLVVVPRVVTSAYPCRVGALKSMSWERRVHKHFALDLNDNVG